MKAVSIGAEWETHLKTIARFQNIVPISLDRPAQWSPQGYRKQKAQFDFIFLGPNAKVICFDAKTTGLKRFPCDKINPDQLKHLMDAGQNCPSGYLVWFRPVDKIVWFSWQELFRIITGPDRSLVPERGLFLGPFQTFKFQPIFDLR